jgi:hypothetical protein
MGKDKYNQPAEGTANWDVPLNENFEDLGVEITGEVATFGDLPAPDPDHESSNGECRKMLVRDSRVVYRDAGSAWEAVAGLGSSSGRVPGTVYHTAHDTEQQVIDGSRLYVQDSEPSNPAEKDIWIDTS